MTTKKLEIINVNSKRSRLTITPERITIKLSNLLTNEEIDKIKKLSLEISEELESTENSWRGEFREDGIRLFLNSKQENKYFTFN